MHLLHERPVLDRAAIRRALDPSPLDVSMLPPAFQALVASDLADQVEQIKITPAAHEQRRDVEAVVGDPVELPALGRLPGVGRPDRRHAPGGHRPCRCCRAASAIRARSATAASSSTPTCCRRCRPCSRPSPRRSRPAPRLGEPVTVEGVRLAGTGHERAALASPARRRRSRSPPSPSMPKASAVTLTLPNDAAAQSDFAAGQLSAERPLHAGRRDAWRARPTPSRSSSPPRPSSPPTRALGLPAAAARAAASAGRCTVTLASRPQVRLEQQATLMLDAVEADRRAARMPPTDPLVFVFPDSLPAGDSLGAAARRRHRQRAASTATVRCRSSTRASRSRCQQMPPDIAGLPGHRVPTWAELNRQWLIAEIGRLRPRGSRRPAAKPRGRGRSAAPRRRSRPRWSRCANVFGLSAFERRAAAAGRRAASSTAGCARRSRRSSAAASARATFGLALAALAAAALGCALARRAAAPLAAGRTRAGRRS